MSDDLLDQLCDDLADIGKRRDALDAELEAIKGRMRVLLEGPPSRPIKPSGLNGDARRAKTRNAAAGDARVLDMITAKPMKPADLARELSLPASSVSNKLHLLKRQGRASADWQGLWSPTASASASPPT
jgi:hypothetical protein